MSSGIYVKIKLHPFYQQFIRCHYQEFQPVFSFPPRDRFMLLLEHLLAKHPSITPPNFDKDAFLIEIPTMPHKDPFYYNYLSQQSKVLITHRLKNFCNHIMFDKIYDLRRKGFEKQEIVIILMEEYSVNPLYEDMIKKAYNRTINAERMRKYRKQQKTAKYAKL